MTFIPKPRVIHPNLPKNKLGLTIRDYEGTMSTLCAGCGHDSVTAGIIQAFHELDTEPHRVVKLSGIGCSSKTPTYFLNAAHGFNSAHGRMPSIASGANAANRSLAYIGISGDGDSLSIGLGQLSHVIRRNLNMLYVIENNGVYGLTKGQFSASADIGTKSKKGEANAYAPIDPALLALSLGATFVGRSFSGDKRQLVPLIKAGLRHKGFALIDVISPCVTFNDHEGSTKSYKYTRERDVEIVHTDFHTDFVPLTSEITANVEERGTSVTMHDGSVVRFTRVAEGYDPRNRETAMAYLMEHQKSGQVPTGLLYVDETAPEMHEIAGTVEQPLNEVPFAKLCPGNKALDELQEAFR
jgi:2-oxoglutarate/2-oxoacid ferredoxin oxidoreductase subunit beta